MTKLMTRIARNLQKCICDEDLVRARWLVENLSREERKAVTRQQVHNESLLWWAVHQGKTDFVTFLLEECHSEPDHRHSKESTVLGYAAMTSQLEMVKILVDHGADVNYASQCDRCTTAFQLSGTDHTDLLRYVVERGADIHLANVYGETCLMHSMVTGSVAVSKYLIEQGATVNAVDNLGDSALHYAVRSSSYYFGFCWPILDRKPSAGLLLRHGADTSICNQSGDDALQTAALHGSPEIIGYIIEELHPTPDRCADVYSLVAARWIDEFANAACAVNWWKTSATIRMETPQDGPKAGLNPVYNGAVEARDVPSLEAIAGDRDALYMQALICRERILGSSHHETIHWLSKRALHYAKSNAFQRGIELYRHAAASYCTAGSALPVATLRDNNPAHVHEEFFQQLLVRSKQEDGVVSFDAATPVLQMMVGITKLMSQAPARRRINSNIKTIVEFSRDAIDLLCRLKSSQPESRTLKQLVRALVQAQGETADVGTASLLHLATRLYSPHWNEPSSATVEELLEAGADVNALDSFGETPLHWTVKWRPRSPSESEAWLRVIDLLLHHGAHADIRNNKGETAADRLPSTVDKMQYTTLQCLAARAIRQHRVTYHNILPTSLTQFVDLH